MNSLKQRLITLFVIISFSLIWIVIIPGFVAYREGVFYKSDVEARLPSHSTRAVSSYDLYRKTQTNNALAIAEIDRQLTELLQRKENTAQIESLIKLRQIYREEQTNSKPPITPSPYFGNRTPSYTFISYIFLGISLFLLMPVPIKTLNLRKAILLGVLLYAGWMFTSWIRNFVVYDEGRTIFSFVNYDIGPLSFLLQELRILGLCLMIAALWQGWTSYFTTVADQYRRDSAHEESLVSLGNNALFIAQMFNRWQLTSIALLGAFLPWTFLYWSNIVNYGDSRYVIPALVVHLYWIVSWGLTTAPLIYAYKRWAAAKTRALAEAATSNRQREPDRSIKFVREINPISSFQVFGAGVATAISFLLPFKDLVF